MLGITRNGPCGRPLASTLLEGPIPRPGSRPGWMSSLIVLLGVLIVSEATAADAPESDEPALDASAFRPPIEFKGDLDGLRSPLLFRDGRPVRDADDWRARRREILDDWRGLMGTWPPRLEHPGFEVLESEPRDGYARERVRLEVAPGRRTDGYLLVPDGEGPRPAVLVVFYEPETAIGEGKKPGRDFALQLVRRGFVTLSIGVDPRPIIPEAVALGLQPLSYLASWAANAGTALAGRPEVDPKRIAVMGHSYGGKWAMFAACLDERFASGVWSDPGVAFDESRRNVNYWEPWYLGLDPDRTRTPGLPAPDNPRTGAYRTLIERGMDLHELQSLMAPRPFLVSGGAEDGPERWKALNHVVAVNRLLGFEDRVAMTYRPAHDPTPRSNAQVVEFLTRVLEPGPPADGPRTP